jgi:TonB family protein
MPDPFEFFERPPDLPERRAHARRPVRAIAYAQLDESNGGIILNISEGGFAVYAVASLMDDHLPHIRFQFPESNVWIEASGDILWRSESNRMAGIRFSGLSDDARAQIREWCNAQAAPAISLEASDTGEEAIAPSEAHHEVRLAEANLASVAPPAIDPAASLSASLHATAGLPESRLSNEPLQNSTLPADPPSAGLAGAALRSAAIPKPVRDPAVSRFARLQSLESGGSGARPDALFPKTLPSERKLLQQSIAPTWDSSTWTRIIAICVVLSLAAAWEVRRGALHLFSARNSTTISDGVAQPAPQPDPSLPLATSSAAEPQGSTIASPAAAIGSGQPQTPLGISTNLHTARNGAHGAFDSVVLSPPVRSQNARSAVPIPEAPDLLPLRDHPGAPTSDTPNDAIPLPALPASPMSDPQPPPAPSAQPRPGALIYHVAPSYPSAARSDHVEGDVTLRATIGANGKVIHVEALAGPPALVAAAVDAVSRWRYKPARLGGQPVETQEDVTIEFRLPPTQ